jgi:hypothetical protein
MPETVSTPNGLIATRRLPFEVTAWWREQLGLLVCEEIEHSDLFMLAVAPSKSLKVLDSGNFALEDACRNFLYGLLVTMPISTELAPQLVTGSMESGKATFRQIGRFERPACIAGTPPPVIDSSSIKTAARYADEIQSFTLRQGAYGRAVWALNCFMNGITATHIYEKMRHLIRTIEAFLMPDIGRTERQFKSRTELFIGTRAHDLVATMYKARSNIEHLHDPLMLMEGDTEKERLISLCEIALATETVARYCLQRLLENKGLRQHFENDDAIRSFWNMPEVDRVSAWGDPLDIALARKRFDKNLAALVVE